jgi:tRNA pseudouridine32 synthase/23S rRNA pseudouridine746 synthase
MKRLVLEADPARSVVSQVEEPLGELLGRAVLPGEVLRIAAQGALYVNKARFHDALDLPPRGLLEVFYPELPMTQFVLEPASIVFEDEHLIAVDKPAGVNTSPSPFCDQDCLTWGVQNYLASGFAVHAVHRLDRDTRGLVLVPKHKEAEKGLHTLFRERRIKKVYRALTPKWGPSPDRPLRVVYRIRDELDWRGKAQKCATTVLWEGKTADLWSWLVLPHTGRTHQIRKHFARYLVPLDGDVVYSPTPGNNSLGLCCIQLRFLHPMTGNLLELKL